MRAGNKMFSPYGINDRKERAWQTDLELVHKWKSGSTGMPLVDAMMRELNSTGYLSNRGRQVVASYLTFDLQQDWRFGAYHFEKMLIDHDVQSNIGSWSNTAGLIGRSSAFNVML